MEDFIAYGFYAKRVEDLNEQVRLFMISGKSKWHFHRSRSERCHRSLAELCQCTNLILPEESCLYVEPAGRYLSCLV